MLFSGLVAMDFFEPLANLFESMLRAVEWAGRVDFIALVGLFAGAVFGLRTLSERLSPSFIAVKLAGLRRLPLGLCASLTGYVTMAFLLTALHTAPLPREFMGFTPERKNFFGLTAPDREWLGFVQYVSEKSMRSSDDGRIFDGTSYRIRTQSNRIWPTFIFRYATRRDAASSGLDVSSTTAGGSSPSGTSVSRPIAPVQPGGM